MAVPEAVDAGDPQQDEDDPILVEGYRLAKELVEACKEQGRKRRLEAYGSSGGPGGSAPTVVPDRSVGRHTTQSSPLQSTVLVAELTAIKEPTWLAIGTRTRPTVRGTIRHGSSLLQPQGASRV